MRGGHNSHDDDVRRCSLLLFTPPRGPPQAQQQEELPRLDQRGGPQPPDLDAEGRQHEGGLPEVLRRNPARKSTGNPKWVCNEKKPLLGFLDIFSKCMLN